MELHKRFCREKNYHSLIKATYEIWMGKVSWHKKGRMKKKLLQLELALFYLTQGKFAEAHCYTKFLVSDESEQAPSINLIHGLVLYQLWYADLPEEMQIKGLDVQTSLDAHGMSSVDLCQESDKGESSNGHDAIDVEKSKGSSRCSSESSVGNEKLSPEQKNVIHRKKSGQPSHSQGFHAFQFFEDDELMGHPQIKITSLIVPSIWHLNCTFSTCSPSVIETLALNAVGLDKILLPIHLKLLVEDPVQSVLLYRKLANENYREAVKHLHLALHSTPPLLAALLPLIQLLLLGDRVHEAIMELDYSCSVLDSALPFRLKARLLQCFHRDQITLISSCYQNALVRDPTCNYSMERLIKIHKSGNYSTLRLVEMLAMHLDAVDGKCGIWEELASCFLQLQRAMPSDYEDRVSTNVEAVKDISSCYRIPRIFIDGEAVDSWMIRCRWWASRHFCKRILLSEIQSGEQMLLQFKAACAAHLYGPNFEYVSAVVNSLQQQGNAEQISYLRLHIKNSLKLAENLLAS
ncbi:hypothetical protein HPP92_010568 [Vanilla planifolia]|uniref:Uncharacterized protein n=1 Tax=Vanilla planifolia TaxID=51239 RepID=A0A835V075_VANPL|nr:hypothetical protein HPP92_010568 [Vanilla planifolia]